MRTYAQTTAPHWKYPALSFQTYPPHEIRLFRFYAPVQTNETPTVSSISALLDEDEDDEDDTDDIGDVELEEEDDDDLSRGKGHKKKGHKLKPKKYAKYMLPLLLAYKLKFFSLIPVMIGGLVLLVGATGLAGFFFALFAAVMGLQKGSY